MIKFLIGTVIVLVFLLAIHLLGVVAFKRQAALLRNRIVRGRPACRSTAPIPQLILNYTARAGVPKDRLAQAVILTQIAEMRLKRGADWQKLTADETRTGEKHQSPSGAASPPTPDFPSDRRFRRH